jgi:hypothetical protein
MSILSPQDRGVVRRIEFGGHGGVVQRREPHLVLRLLDYGVRKAIVQYLRRLVYQHLILVEAIDGWRRGGYIARDRTGRAFWGH